MGLAHGSDSQETVRRNLPPSGFLALWPGDPRSQVGAFDGALLCCDEQVKALSHFSFVINLRSRKHGLGNSLSGHDQHLGINVTRGLVASRASEADKFVGFLRPSTHRTGSPHRVHRRSRSPPRYSVSNTHSSSRPFEHHRAFRSARLWFVRALLCRSHSF